jgi:pre-mRNA-splicing helicase BRR2
VPISDDDDEGEDAMAAGGNLNTDMDLGAAEDDALALNVNEIDAYWLQRAIAEAYKKDDEPLDAAAAQQKDRDVLRLLAGNSEVAELEADLLFQLDYKRFELIKV